MVGMKSSATVQQMQPLASSMMFSAGQSGMAQDFKISPSTPTSPNSLTTTARRLPWGFCIRWRINVVLPAPRKPVMTVTGSFDRSGIGDLQWRYARNTVFTEMFGALAPRNNTVLSGLILGDTLYDRVQMRHFMQVSVNIGPASRTAQSNRAAIRAVRQARYVAQRDTSRQRLAGQLLQQLPAGSHGVCVIRLAATTFGANKNFNAALCQGSGASGVYRNGIRCRSLY